MKLELELTDDGSHTLFNSEINEHFHSVHGAINESNHVFIKNGLEHFIQKHDVPKIKILEVGMGTGLNVLLTLLFASNFKNRTIDYYALEPFPIGKDIVKQLNYSAILNFDNAESCFERIHEGKCDVELKLTELFTLTKSRKTVSEFEPIEKYDLVYFDAFSPNVQNELWTIPVFDKIFKSLNAGGVLVTYCAKGEVKRMLKSVGFIVESLAGPPKKREMVRAKKLI